MYKCCQKYISSIVLGKLNISYCNVFSSIRTICKYKVCSNLKQLSTIPTKDAVVKEITGLDGLVNYVSNSRRIDMKHISNVLHKIEDDNLAEEHVLFLLECCGQIIPSETLDTKHQTCQLILNKFEHHLKHSERIYQTFINVCTHNRKTVDIDTLISSMGNNISFTTLKLLMKNVCERGDIDKALRVLTEVKSRGYAADEDIFNELILCHTINGGLQSGLPVLQTMHMAKLSESNKTRYALIKGLAQRNDVKEFIQALDDYPIQFSGEILLNLLETIGFAGNQTWIEYITKLIDDKLLSRHFIVDLEKLCMNLIHNSMYDSAKEIYKMFVKPKSDSGYGASILREMLICSSPVEKIVEFAGELKKSGLNEYALEDVTDLALKYRLTKSAMKLFEHFDTLRPHYFFPLMVKAYTSEGEKGLMNVVKDVGELNVKFDSYSFQNYIFPFCDLRNPQRVIQNFQTLGYTVRSLLTPMIVTLLCKKETKLAMRTCNAYDVQIGSKDLIEILPYTWIGTIDNDVCLCFIQKISEFDNVLLLGNFLTEILSKLKNPSRLRPFLQLLKDSKRRRLVVDSTSADTLVNILKNNFSSSAMLPELEDAINDLLDFTKATVVPHILHPRDMKTEELECHLTELKSKGMETRGVLRRLIQNHTNEGNWKRVGELQEDLLSKQYVASPGIKSSLMYTNIQNGNLSEAKKLFDELKKVSPQFNIDVFKIVDLATLLVKNNQFDEAVDLLKQEAKHRKLEPAKCNIRNCKILLSAIKDLEKQKIMFDILLDNGYCGPYNIILGSIIEQHLEMDSLQNTVDLFVELARKYRTTPMQIVLLCRTLESEDQELFQKVLEAIDSVYGNSVAHSSLLTAFCEKGYTKKLVTFLQESRLNPIKEMERKCDRWVEVNNLKPLETLLEASREVSSKLLNRSKIQLSIMKIYSKNNDCDGALEFWKTLIDHEDLIGIEVDMEFCNLLDRCKYDWPENLDLKYKVK